MDHHEYGQMSDEELMLAFQDGDDNAFSALVPRYKDRIFNYVYRITSDLERSEEVAQEVFIRVFRSRERYRVTAKFATFIYQIARNLAFNEVRNRNRQKTDVTEDFSTLADRDKPDDLLERDILEKTIWNEINTLAPKYRDVVILCDIERFSYKEAGETLGISVGTVQSRLSRGRMKLRQKLTQVLQLDGNN